MNKAVQQFLLFLIFSTFLIISQHSLAQNQPAPTNNEEYSNAYIYGYPLVLMEITKNVMTNVPKVTITSTGPRAPINQFAHMPQFPSADFHDVIRPNVDTLYSIAWLDLSQGPLVLSLPNTNNRYYVLQMLDAWTNVFAAPGSRTTGTQAQNFLITGPNWKGEIPTGLQQLQAPSNMVWIIGRIQTNGVADYQNVQQLQAQIKLVPLASWGKTYTPATDVATNASVNMTMAPKDQVLNMDAPTFLKTLASALKTNPPLPGDTQMISILKTVGITPGQDFDASQLSAAQLTQIQSAFDDAQKIIVDKSQQLSRITNGWQIIRDNVGDYGGNYLMRAAVAYYGLGANLPQDAIYPATNMDAQGQILNGANNYVLHFDKGQLPPVKAFWSVTLYTPQGFLFDNPLNRYALGDRDKMQFNADGSLDIYIQNASPGKNKESNWLPTPKDNFNLLMRLYWPGPEIIDGSWNPPAVQKVS